jgi:ribosome-associated toxin RatA of RatAB toxin-antitoxin module
MHLTNAITIDGELETIYRLGAEIERWPEILPHYRSVEVLHRADDWSEVEAKMAARRGRIPVSWTCRQWRDPDEPRIRFEHIGGFTRGMQVAWTFERHDDGRVTVRIDHEFRKGWPVLDSFVSEKVVGEFFVAAIAGKTLARVKVLAERERTARQLAAQA